jgi:hypothetical protein
MPSSGMFVSYCYTVPSSLVPSILKTEATRSSETLVLTRSTSCHNPEDTFFIMLCVCVIHYKCFIFYDVGVVLEDVMRLVLPRTYVVLPPAAVQKLW